MLAFRIADGRHPILDSTGAFLKGGRWNSPGRRVLYAAQTYAGAMLEILVHAGISTLPRTHVSIRIDIPAMLPVETLVPEALPGWDLPDLLASRSFGDRWLSEQRTAVVLVPSVILRGHESNILLNPDHPDFRLIAASPPEPVLWDPHLSSR